MNDDGPVLGLVCMMNPPTKGNIRNAVPGVGTHYFIVDAWDNGVDPVLHELAPDDAGPNKRIKAHHVRKYKTTGGRGKVNRNDYVVKGFGKSRNSGGRGGIKGNVGAPHVVPGQHIHDAGNDY